MDNNNKQPLSTLIHYQDSYQSLSLKEVKQGIKEAIEQRHLYLPSVYQAALLGAIYYDRIDVLNYVLEEQKIQLGDEFLEKLLEKSVSHKSFVCAEFLIDKDIAFEVNKNTISYLTDAPLEFVKKLEHKGYELYTPKNFFLVQILGHSPVNKELADYIFSKGDALETVLERRDLCYYLTSYDGPENIEKIEYLMSKGFDIYFNNRQLLTWAVQSELEEITAYLLSKDTQLDVKSSNLLDFCYNHESEDVLNLLLKKGYNLDLNNHSLMIKAAKNDNLFIVQYLVKKGYDIEIAKSYGSEVVQQWCVQQLHDQLEERLDDHKQLNHKKNKI